MDSRDVSCVRIAFNNVLCTFIYCKTWKYDHANGGFDAKKLSKIENTGEKKKKSTKQ